MDFEAIKKAAQAYGPDMTRFLRDMIAIPSESCEEKGVAHRIAEEMKKLGYDKVEFDAHHALWGTERIGADEKAMSTRIGRPLTDKWTFSTNGVSIQGRYGIPCVGFGPGAESQAHAPNEITWKQDLVTCAALYAAVPGLYKPENKDGSATSFRQELTGNNIK